MLGLHYLAFRGRQQKSPAPLQRLQSSGSIYKARVYLTLKVHFKTNILIHVGHL